VGVRTVAAIAFIAGVAATAVYVGTRPTIARGEVFAEILREANAATLAAVACDPDIEIANDGARFACRTTFRSGVTERLEFVMDRAGSIRQANHTRHELKNSADPWGD
jgi:hypothetical protein